MADSETSSRQCPDTGQNNPETSEDTEVTSASGEGTNGSASASPKSNPFQAVKPAKFVPTVSSASMNPFAARPTLKSDVVSTSGMNSGAPSPAKFILRPSALSAQPQNNTNDVCGVDTDTVPTLLKPAKLHVPDHTKENEVTEKENKDCATVFGASSVLRDCEPPDSGGENLFQAALQEHIAEKKLPDSSCSPSKSNSATSSADGDNILGQNLTERVTGVHTSPKGTVSSSGFVFGENLAERVQFCIDEIGKSSEDNGVASPDSTDQSDVVSNGEGIKTLEESAREYQATHKRETELEEVEVVTGEENESNVLQSNGKLFVFDGETQNWVERGRGLLRLNDMRCESAQTFQSRLVMRTQGSLRLILNTKIWPGMTVERASQKSVRVTGTDGDLVKVFLIQTNPNESENLLRALDWRVQQQRVQEDMLKDSGVKGAEKRKAEPESPTEEFTVKKTKKFDDDVQASYKREESDSSVVDPETEVSSESHASSFTLRTDSD